MGMWFAPGVLDMAYMIAIVAGTTLLVGAANALNAYIERDTDGLMERTRDRPLPAGRLEPHVALVLGIVIGVASVATLAFASNTLTAVLGAIAFALYVAVYTPLKKLSSWALPIGAIPGAMPPLMGWTAVTGSVDLGGMLLFGILFTWQLPHFLAISLYLQEDYARGGLKVVPEVWGTHITKILIVLTSALMAMASLAPYFVGMASQTYGVVASILITGFVIWSFSGLMTDNRTEWAKRLFFGTLIYLPLLLGVLSATANR